jgi:hypothetical protein
MPSEGARPIVPSGNPSKKGASKKGSKDVQPKKGKGKAPTKDQSEEPERGNVDLKKLMTRSKAAAQNRLLDRKAGKSKLRAATEVFTLEKEEEGPVETNKGQRVTRSSKPKDVSPGLGPTPSPSFTLDIPTCKGNKRKLDEEQEDESSAEVPPRKKSKAIHIESKDEAPASSKPPRKRKTSPDIREDDVDVSRPPSKKIRVAQVTVDEAPVANATRTKANVISLASFPQIQSFDDATTLPRASQERNRVFAMWALDGMYYCGTVKEMRKRDDEVRVCSVEYDDGNVVEVLPEGLRRCELWVGDVVEIPTSAKGKMRKSATVVSVDEWEEHGHVRVSFTKGKRQVEVDVESGDVSVPAAQVERNVSWNWRKLSMEDLETSILVDDKNYRDYTEETTQKTLDPASTIIKSRTNAASSTRRTTRTDEDSEKSTPPFAGDAFLIALSLPDSVTRRTLDSKDREQTKKRLKECITSQGGVYIEDWNDLLQLQGTADDCRWIWEKSEDINYLRMQAGGGSTRQKSRIDRVWVLADGHNKNTKYFTALALGVPCVRPRWVEDGVRETRYSLKKLSVDLCS